MRYQFDDIDMLAAGQPWHNRSPKAVLQYAIGGLLYTPASYDKAAEILCTNRYPDMKALALCLEDAIQAASTAQVENQLLDSMEQVAQAVARGVIAQENLPLVFIRTRTPQQMLTLFERLRPYAHLLTGFIAPKFDTTVMTAYGQAIQAINEGSDGPLYLMPILESASVIAAESRVRELLRIKDYLQTIAPYILNVRVGGNDFCNYFGLRRSVTDSIYDIGLLNGVLMDILNLFSRDYVVSAPVWEYFAGGDDRWRQGLLRELHRDRLNGFIGKTAVHPTQLPLIQRSLVVSEEDYLDARQILNWEDGLLGVHKGVNSRMNEETVHQRWAQKVMQLAEIYGVRRGA